MEKVLDDGRVFVDMPDDSSNPCLSCGACCAHFRISFYQGEMSTQPMGFVPAEMVTQLTPFLACMKGTELGGGRCTALVGEVGKNITCAIYESRPTPCREYRVWMADGTPNVDCQRLRAAIGLPPLVPQMHGLQVDGSSIR